jgi:hypothetical protein
MGEPVTIFFGLFSYISEKVKYVTRNSGIKQFSLGISFFLFSDWTGTIKLKKVINYIYYLMQGDVRENIIYISCGESVIVINPQC